MTKRKKSQRTQKIPKFSLFIIDGISDHLVDRLISTEESVQRRFYNESIIIAVHCCCPGMGAFLAGTHSSADYWTAIKIGVFSVDVKTVPNPVP